MTTIEQMRRDPVEFARFHIGCGELQPWQEDMLRRIVSGERVAIQYPRNSRISKSRIAELALQFRSAR